MPNNFSSLRILISPFFVTALAALLINDFFLKAYFHNFTTGKLSDFAGLFVFSILWTAIVPRAKKFIFIFTVIFFAFWKSSLSDGFIEFWNWLPFFDVERTIDYSDLAALTVLPLAWLHAKSIETFSPLEISRQFATVVVVAVSLFAFTATSQPGKMNQMEEYNDKYKIEASPLDVTKKLQEIKTADFSEKKNQNQGNAMFNIEMNEKVCDGFPNVFFIVSGDKDNNSIIELKHVLYPCDNKLPDQSENLKKMFELEVIDFLKTSPSR